MKPIISLSSFIGLLIVGIQIVYAQNTSCPKTKESDILRIHSFLTSQEFQSDRERSNIKDYSFDLNDLKRQHTEAFRKYWKNKGVHAVSNPKLCQKITNALNSNTNVKGFFDEFSPIYYKVKNQYVILYRPKNARGNIPPLPVQVLDEDLNIISNFRI
jgi:hypothetical protein